MLHARLANASAPRATWLLRPSTRVTAINSSTNSFQLEALRLQATASRRGFSSSSNKSSSSSGNTSENIFARAWAKYLALLESRPLATKIATGGAIAGIGDINCQIFLEPGHPFSVKRAATFTFIGGVFISPILHVWYAFLSRALPGTSTLAIAKRLALDQLGFAPTFLPIFFTALLTLEGDVAKVPKKIEEEWWPAVKTNWVVWVPAQLLNFRFVPGNLQVLFSNVVGLFWNSYLSFISHTAAHAAHAAVEPAVEPAAEPAVESAVEPADVAATKPLLVNE